MTPLIHHCYLDVWKFSDRVVDNRVDYFTRCDVGNRLPPFEFLHALGIRS